MKRAAAAPAAPASNIAAWLALMLGMYWSLTTGARVGAAASPPAAPAARSASGIELGSMQPAVDPCADFYRYACGGWLAANPVPPDRPNWSRFVEVAERNRLRLRALLEADAAPLPPRSADRQKLGDFYASCMDEAAAEQRDVAPLRPELDRIAALRSTAELPAVVAHLRRLGAGVLFAVTNGQDLEDATSVIAFVEAGGLGLPDRDYYLKTDDKSLEQRQAYRQHVQRMLGLLGEPAERAEADAAAVVELETELARATLDRVSRRDPHRLYHKLDRRGLQALTPSLSWDAYLADLGVPPVGTVNVTEPDFLRAVEGQLRGTGLATWQAYLRWHLAHAAAPWLSSRFVDENFAFFGKALGGTRQLQPRWQRCVEAVDRGIGEALGREFVAAAFDPGAKPRIAALVGEVEGAMGRDIAALPWMSEATRLRAAEKLAAMAHKLAYPEVWRDYSRLTIARGDLVGNVWRTHAFELDRRLAEIGKPVNRQQWTMTPPTVNAYYSSSMNDINITAGILQPPFYDPLRDDAVNFGAIGAIIGHEMTHGFDDRGSQFDGKGNLLNWWTPADAAEFARRTTCIADQYSGFPAAGGLHVNGRTTLGENIADNGGLRIGYLAYQSSLAGKPRQTLDGFTPEQRFFLGFAQVWCSNSTPEAERLQVLTNPHSPGRYRTNGSLANDPDFQQAFHCPAGAPLAPEQRCRVW
jgi:putative endopeptidase